MLSINNYIVYVFGRRYTILDKIEELRSILHKAMEEDIDEREILKISEELDKLIEEYYKTIDFPS